MDCVNRFAHAHTRPKHTTLGYVIEMKQNKNEPSEIVNLHFDMKWTMMTFCDMVVIAIVCIFEIASNCNPS